MASRSPEEPNDIWYTNATKCVDIKGCNPTIAIANDALAVMMYERSDPVWPLSHLRQLGEAAGREISSSSMFYVIGTLDSSKITWERPEKAFETSGGSAFSSVAVASDGTILAAYVKNRKCFYRVGEKKTERKVEWYEERVIDEGSCPSVSLGRDNTVVVAFISSNCHIYTRVGTVDTATHKIEWMKDKQQLSESNRNSSVSIAMNDNKDVVIAYSTRIDVSNTMVGCRPGQIADGQIHFGKATEAIKGHSPTISINMAGNVLLMFEEYLVQNLLQRHMRNLFAQCGSLQSSRKLKWRDRSADGIDFGHHPSVCLTGEGEFVEVHQSHIPMYNDSLYFRVGHLK